MAASSHPASPLEGVRAEFASFLDRHDIRRLNFEEKVFYHPEDIRIWMRQTSNGGNFSNTGRLLSAAYDPDIYMFPPTTAVQINENHLLVFAILAHPDLQCEHMIHIFRKHIRDDHLHLPDMFNTYCTIIADLELEVSAIPEKYKKEGYQGVTRMFDHLRWAFSPAPLDLNMDQSFPQGSCILPFCSSRTINEKGGTANVHHRKIQQDLVVSESLREVLHPSRKEDSKFGWCYELAVKSYYAGWEDIHRIESQAFKGIRDQEGVVKYLGEYHLVNNSPGDKTPPTRHIVLEYGELDLDEYLAETYPPILNEEIISFWESLFEVAKTIKRIHNLKQTTGDERERFFKGWHGDIKPDNILRVRGDYKLADFGFTKFEKDTVGLDSTILLGGTRTYGEGHQSAALNVADISGAPECDIKVRGGTLTPQMQTIDTWSFGCVLSAVATWVVLGSQAYENYGKRRELAISDLRQQTQKPGSRNILPTCSDAFHDGRKVLLAVSEWHDYLRNSSRRADTITPLILDLIDREMLLEHPQGRLTSVQLCQKLDEILLQARDSYTTAVEGGHLKRESSKTLEALLKLDEHAPTVAAPASQAKAGHKLLSPDGSTESSPSAPAPTYSQRLVPPSSRVRKSERFNKIVYAKTANREEVIKGDLGLSNTSGHQAVSIDHEQQPAQVAPLRQKGRGADNPAFVLTDSPSPMQEPRMALPPPPRPKIDYLGSRGGSPPEQYIEHTRQDPRQYLSHGLPTQETGNYVSPVSHNIPAEQSNASVNAYTYHQRHSPTTGLPSRVGRTNRDQQQGQRYGQYRTATQDNADLVSPLSSHTEARPSSSTPVWRSDELLNPSVPRIVPPESQFSQPPMTPPPAPRRQSTAHGIAELPADAGHYDYRGPSQQSPRYGHEQRHSPENTTHQISHANHGHDNGQVPGIWMEPPNPRTTAIWQEHEYLTRLWGDKRGPWTKLIGKVPEDRRLKRFISNRDIVFVVDNAASMKPHWKNVTVTLLALAMKIGPLDKDGLDVVYTVGDSSCNRSNVSQWSIPSEFGQSMKEAQREIETGDRTDMATTLKKLFDRYKNMSKKQTLIILTDGLWEGSNSKEDVETAITSFITDVKRQLKKYEPRWFSIQFISFGHDPVALDRLRGLDDDLKTKFHSEEDVVDTKPWDYSEVDKMITGSMLQDSDEPPEATSFGGSLRSPSPVPSDRSSLGRKKSKMDRLSSFFNNKESGRA